MANGEAVNREIIFLGTDEDMFAELFALAASEGLEVRHATEPEGLVSPARREGPGILLYPLSDGKDMAKKVRRDPDGLPLFIPISERGNGLNRDEMPADEIPAKDLFGVLESPLNPLQVITTLRSAQKMIQTMLTSRTLSQRVKVFHNQWIKLNQIGIALSTIHDLGELLNFILKKCREITSADSGSLYLKEAPQDGDPSHGALVPILRFKVAQNDSKFIPFKEWTMPARKEAVSGYVALEGEEILIDDVYHLPPDSPFRFDSSFDRTSGYRTKSMLVVPMRNHKDEIIGVIQLINKKHRPTDALRTPQDAETKVIPFDRDDRELAKSLASQAGVAIENARLMEDIKVAMGNLKVANDELHKAKQQIEDLFEAFVRTCAKAIEARDNALSGHTDRIALYALSVARKLNEISTGPLAPFKFTDTELKALKYAAILHDFGKIGVREEILWKSSRLKSERLETVAYRFEAFKGRLRDHHSRQAIKFILENRGMSGLAEVLAEHERQLQEECRSLDRDLAFVQRITKLGYLSDEDLDELNVLRDRRLLIDNELIPLITEQEYEHLSVRKGNLTASEWVEMKRHVALTHEILSTIPWQGQLRMIPDVAGSHHERRDGTGYHRGLTLDEIPIGGQILAMVDIYEALTASDRPYKKQFTQDEALRFLDDCARTNWLNADIVQLFIQHRLYEIALPDDAKIPRATSE